MSDTVFLEIGEQRNAITHTGGPLLLVAGAGSGKTTVMAKRMVHFVTHEGMRADQILGLTFSNKAASNLRDRAQQELGAGNDVQVQTYNGFGASILLDHYNELGFRRAPRLLDRARAWQLLYRVLDSVVITHRKTGNLSYLINSALQLVSSCSDHLVAIDTVVANCHELLDRGDLAKSAAATLRARLDLCALASAYESAKRTYGYVDFNDQISLSVQLLETRPGLRRELHDRHRAVLLDEYQDTNYAQRRMIELFTMPLGLDEAKKSPPNVTAVGDDMQSIYAFRGAHIANILAFEHHLPSTTVLRLETNHRSGPEIVALANHVQSYVASAREKTLQARADREPSRVERFVGADDQAEAQRIAERCAIIGAPWNEIAVLCRKRKIIPAIAEALSAKGIPVEVIGMGGLLVRPEIVDLIAWCEIAVSADAHDLNPVAQSGAISNSGAISKSGAISNSGTGIEHHAHWREQRAWNGPDPSVALLRILRGPSYRIGLRDIAALARHARNVASRERANTGNTTDVGKNGNTTDVAAEQLVSRHVDLVSALTESDTVTDLSSQAWTRLKDFLNIRASLRTLAREQTRVPDFLEAVIVSIGLWDAVDRRGRENLLRFLDLAERFTRLDDHPTDHKPHSHADQETGLNSDVHADRSEQSPRSRSGLLEFLEYLALISESEDDQAEAVNTGVDAVRVMTIHQSKGLEFDTVFLPGLAGDKTSNIFPDERLPQNGATQANVLPLWLRPDSEVGTISPKLKTKADLDFFALNSRNALHEEELRLLYVAVTRARKDLICSAAHWYPGPKKPQGESIFYDLIGASGVAPESSREDATNENPATAARLRRLTATTDKTGTSMPSQAHPHVPTKVQLRPTKKKRSATNVEQGLLLGADVGVAQQQGTSTEPRVLGPLAATSIGIASLCRRKFYWSFVQPLPRRSSEAARIGSIVHRWIEHQGSGQMTMIDATERADSDPGHDPFHEPSIETTFESTSETTFESTSELSIESDSFDENVVSDLLSKNNTRTYEIELIGPQTTSANLLADREARSKANFLASRFAQLLPNRSEAPFVFSLLTPLGEQFIRGRIDATYLDTSGDTEIVDFKTGRAPEKASLSDLATETQLLIYGLVAIDRFRIPPHQIRTTACYLGGDTTEERTIAWTEQTAMNARTRVSHLLNLLHNGNFQVNPSPACHSCDFSAYCEGAKIWAEHSKAPS
jgi:DNA helicase II / ATP-dependent DNA helicase PcrA